MTNLVVGGVPRGEDYFGQELLVRSIWERLEKDNVLLAAPRRFGKTAAMYKLLDEPHGEFTPVYTNLEHIKTAGDFMVELISIIFQKKQFRRIVKKLWKSSKGIASYFRNLPEDIDIGGIKIKIRENSDVPTHWLMYGERIMDLLSHEKPSLLLILDEFAVMIDHISRREKDEAEQLLRWFRSARTAPGTRTRFVIGGSIHLLPMLDSMGMVDTVNDLYVQKLRPFTLETAQLYIDAIFAARQIELPDEARDKILELVGEPIPYFLAVFLAEIFEQIKATGQKVDPALVRTVFEEILSGSGTATFLHYRSRIHDYYPGWEEQAAKSILGLLSRADSGIEGQTLYHLHLKSTNMTHSSESEEHFIRLMNKLDNDFYILYREEKYSFYSRVLKLWWKGKYGFQGE